MSSADGHLRMHASWPLPYKVTFRFAVLLFTQGFRLILHV